MPSVEDRVGFFGECGYMATPWWCELLVPALCADLDPVALDQDHMTTDAAATEKISGDCE